ncbi:hypothetical protein [Halorussus amylolyticus]|uniref:hypothetical protein n=1 Tax=Halorussus amylolyticus TaxID=1126242 RepID=UPI0010461DBE|nr:hypothetical protein [Halorussus amylolyticus]
MAGDPSGNENSDDPSVAELKESLRESEHIVAEPEAYHRFTEESVSFDSLSASDLPDDPEIYFGEYKNAEAPSGKYVEVGSPTELQQRDVPLALQGEAESRVVGENNVVEPEVSDFFYVEGDVGSATLEAHGHGITVDVAVGAGLTIDLITSDLQVGATLSMDITFTVNGVSFTVSPVSFGVSAGPSDRDGYCIGPIGIDWGYLPGGEVELCGSFQINSHPNGEISLVFSVGGLDVCADPCPGINCPVCASVVASSISFETPSFDPNPF